MVDRVIAPDPADDVAAVEAEKLVQFRAREIQRAPRAAAILAEGQHRRVLAEHRADRVPLRCHYFDHFRRIVQVSCAAICRRFGGGGRRCDRLPPAARRDSARRRGLRRLERADMVPPHCRGMRSGEFVSDIFREIDDELRRENLLQLWSRYSRYIIAAAVLLALIAGGIFAWRQHLASERLAQANRYTAAAGARPPGQGAGGGQAVRRRGEQWRRLWHPGRAFRRPRCSPRPATARGRSRPMTVSRRRRGRSRIPRPRDLARRSCTSSRTAIRRPRSSGSRL